MAYTGLPNGDITWAVNELVTSAKMNLFSANVSDIANYLSTFDPNDGVLTIKVNGTTVGTFTANDVNNVNVDIPVPTKVTDLSDAGDFARATDVPQNVSQLNNDEGYVKASDINTVNDATLKIQKNGTDVASFTANSSTDQTANLIIPEYVSDLGDAANYYTKLEADNAINAAVASLTSASLKYQIVENLPTVNIDQHTVYLHKDNGNEFYDQWMYISGSWAHLGKTEVDMSQYALKTDLNSIVSANNATIRVTNYDDTLIDSFSLNQSNNQTIKLPNPTGTLDTALSPTSTNAVQNKAIYDAIKDSTISLKDDDGSTIGSFTANQSSDVDVTIPAATGTKFGLTKIVTSTTDIGEGAALAEGTIYCVVSA